MQKVSLRRFQIASEIEGFDFQRSYQDARGVVNNSDSTDFSGDLGATVPNPSDAYESTQSQSGVHGLGLKVMYNAGRESQSQQVPSLSVCLYNSFEEG